jgi:hypothetical protein
LGLQGGVDVHQASSLGSGGAPSAVIWPVTRRRAASADKAVGHHYWIPLYSRRDGTAVAACRFTEKVYGL